jgi:predicted permease
MAACAFTFLALAAVRVLLLLVLPARTARRVLPALQFVLLLALLTLLLMLPLIVMETRPAIEAASHAVYLWPPLWFLGLEEVIIGRADPVFVELTRIATGAFTCAAVVASVGYLATFVTTQRRLCGQTPIASASAARLVSFVLRRIAARVAPDGPTRATFFFTAQTLLRSGRHRLCVAGHLGLGLAFVVASMLAAHVGISVNRRPLDLDSMAFAAQGNLLFFLLVGVRVAAGFPSDLHAAWVFRLRAMPALRRYQAGTRWAFVLLGVVPLLLLLVPVHVLLWGWYAASVHFAWGCVLALLLIDLLFRGSDRIPFVTAFAPHRTVLSLRLPFYILGYLVFVYVPPEIERVLIRRPDLFVAWAGLFVMMVARFLAWQSSLFHHDRMPVFEEPGEHVHLGLAGWSPLDGSQGGARPELRPADVAPDGMAAGQGFSGARGTGISSPPTRWLAIDTARVSNAEAQTETPLAATWRPRFEPVGQELRFALRRLRSAPAFTLFAVITLALGIGATTVIYSVIDAAILTPPNIRNIDYVVNLYHSDPRKGNRTDIAFSLPDYQDLRRTQTVFSALTAWLEFTQTLVANGAGEVVVGELVSGEYFKVVGVLPARIPGQARRRPGAGRMLQPADDVPGAPRVVVISDDIWRRRFGADPAVVGKTVRMNGHLFEVVGVAPASFRGVFAPNIIPTRVWVPLSCIDLLREGARGGDSQDRDARWLLVKGFLKRGRTIAQAAAEVTTIGRRLDAVYPIGRDVPPQYRWTPSATRSWVARPAADFHVNEEVDRVILPLAAAVMVAVGLVLLVACTNLANLMLARGASRRQELAVRLALGASRWRLVREQIVESVLVAFAGACAAIVVARLMIGYVSSVSVPLVLGFRLHVAPSLNFSVGLVAVAATGLALAVFGLAPALQLTRTDVRSALSADTANVAVPRWRGRRNLITGQVAVSVALLAVAALYMHQVTESSLGHAGIDLDRVALVQLDFRMQGYSEDRARRTLDQVLDLARREPGIEIAALSSGVPGATAVQTADLTLPDHPFERGRYYGPGLQMVSATPGVFGALCVPIRRGRGFDERDTNQAGRVVVLSERAARTLFGATDPIGRQALMRAYLASEKRTVVEAVTVLGVAADTDSDAAGRRDGAVVYVPFAQRYEPTVTIVARARRDPAMLVGRVRELALRADPELAILETGTGTAVAGARSVMPKMMAALGGLLGVLALALAMAGLYGVLSYIVAGRTREVGVRMALGATRPRILALVLVDGIRPVLEGLAIGFAVAGLSGLVLQPAFVRVLPAIDPVTFVLLPIPFVIAALVACYLPAHRAASVDPNVALKQL